MTVLSAALLLFFVLDPIGNIPMFICALKKVERTRHIRIIIRELFIALVFLLIFLFAGKYIFKFFNISQVSLSIASGIVLFLIAIKMIFYGSEAVFNNAAVNEPFIVPLAVPLIAGPSAMAVITLQMAKSPDNWFDLFIAIIIAWTVSGIILVFSDKIESLLGERAITAIERLMGMILTTISVELFIEGLRKLTT